MAGAQAAARCSWLACVHEPVREPQASGCTDGNASEARSDPALGPPTHLQLPQRGVQAGQGGGAVGAVAHQLGNHGVIKCAHLSKASLAGGCGTLGAGLETKREVGGRVARQGCDRGVARGALLLRCDSHNTTLQEGLHGSAWLSSTSQDRPAKRCIETSFSQVSQPAPPHRVALHHARVNPDRSIGEEGGVGGHPPPKHPAGAGDRSKRQRRLVTCPCLKP